MFVGGPLKVRGWMLDVPLFFDWNIDGIAMRRHAGATAILAPEAIARVYAPIIVLWRQNERYHKAVNWFRAAPAIVTGTTGGRLTPRSRHAARWFGVSAAGAR